MANLRGRVPSGGFQGRRENSAGRQRYDRLHFSGFRTTARTGVTHLTHLARSSIIHRLFRCLIKTVKNQFRCWVTRSAKVRRVTPVRAVVRQFWT